MEKFYKEKLTIDRLTLTFTLTALSGCLAWIFVNRPTASFEQILLNGLGIVILFVLLIITLYNIENNLNNLKEYLK